MRSDEKILHLDKLGSRIISKVYFETEKGQVLKSNTANLLKTNGLAMPLCERAHFTLAYAIYKVMF